MGMAAARFEKIKEMDGIFVKEKGMKEKMGWMDGLTGRKIGWGSGEMRK